MKLFSCLFGLVLVLVAITARDVNEDIMMLKRRALGERMRARTADGTGASKARQLSEAQLAARERVKRAQHVPHNKRNLDLGLSDLSQPAKRQYRPSQPSPALCSGTTYRVCSLTGGSGSTCCKSGLSCQSLTIPLGFSYNTAICTQDIQADSAALAPQIQAQGIRSEYQLENFLNGKAAYTRKRSVA